jgi:hypothetical protein
MRKAIIAIAASAAVLAGCGSVASLRPAPESPSASVKASSSAAGASQPVTSTAQLASLVPGYLRKDLMIACGNSVYPVSPTTGQVSRLILPASGASAEVACSIPANHDAESVVLFVGFPSAAAAQAYYSELLSLNDVTSNSGGCGSQLLVPVEPVSNPLYGNSYCESASLRGRGRVFLYIGGYGGSSNGGGGGGVGAGISLDPLHDTLNGTNDCGFATDKMTMAFTDPAYDEVTIAENCTENSNNMSLMFGDYLAGKLSLGS